MRYNPSEKYELYYKVVNKILRDHLPKGKENEEARSYIYEEKNTFLTRGHRIDGSGLRHADGRMGYNADMKELIDILVEWSSANGTMFDLYARLRDLNESKGYGKPEIEK